MVDYDKDILNITADMDVDLKLNPDFYIHTAILSAQKALLIASLEGKASDGVNAYSIFVKQIQMIAESAGYVNDETRKTIVEQLSSDDGNIVTRANNSSQRLGLILGDIFGHKPQFGSLTFNPKLISELSKENDDYESGKRESVLGDQTK